MMNEQVRRIMTKDPVVVSPNHSVKDVTTIMEDNKLQQMPVVQQGKLVGLVTSYDLWHSSKSEDHPEKVLIQDVMTTNVLKISPLDKVGTAAQLFMDKRFKTLPVVNLRNELKGVITAFDVIRHCFVNEYKKPVLYPEVFERE